ncbi:hypothetical protein J4221_04645 [Candidatus Pacearchaeota archaeon]|nr:hypothetical protein [Candidatus Pacearchaeota archaeon]
MQKRGTKKLKKTSKKNNFEKQLEKEVREIESWMKERRKFLIKLGWVLLFITLLLILSNIFLRVKGVGI